MDSKQLAATVNLIAQLDTGVHSVLIIRNGYVVADAYLHPFS